MNHEEQAAAMAAKEAEAKMKLQKSRGLGDVIRKMTGALGIKPCGGCKKRADKLNELFPFGKS